MWWTHPNSSLTAIAYWQGTVCQTCLWIISVLTAALRSRRLALFHMSKQAYRSWALLWSHPASQWHSRSVTPSDFHLRRSTWISGEAINLWVLMSNLCHGLLAWCTNYIENSHHNKDGSSTYYLPSQAPSALPVPISVILTTTPRSRKLNHWEP